MATRLRCLYDINHMNELQIKNTNERDLRSYEPLGGTTVYKLYGYVPNFRVWFSSCFSLK